jgi:hypothetical protein
MDAGLADHGQQRLGEALDYSSCGTVWGRTVVPAQQSEYAAPPIRSDSLQ